VLKLVKFGDAPAHCPDAEIDALLDRSDADGIVRLPPRAPPRARHVFAAGDRVSIVDGPLKGLSAIHSGMTAREREIVLIDLLGRQRPVAVPAELVQPQGTRQ
jgi:transcription antitermination factor NusG